jgi:hypothetical protein
VLDVRRLDPNAQVEVPPPVLDVRQLGPNAKLTVTPEAELTSNLAMEAGKERHRQRMEIIYLAGTLLVLGGLVATCLSIYFHSGRNADVQKAAVAGITSIITAWFGFVAGKGSPKGG